jgi:hypothetical protein
MSIRLRIYVGPFLTVHSKLDVDELTGGKMTELRGAFDRDGIKQRQYIGPNIKVPTIKRALNFDREVDDDVIEEVDQMAETCAFLEFFNQEIANIKRGAGNGAVNVHWGIVPNWI